MSTTPSGYIREKLKFMNRRNWIITGALAVVAVGIVLAVALRKTASGFDTSSEIDEPEPIELLYGLEHENYDVQYGTIENGQTMGEIFARYGVGPARVDAISRIADSVFSFRRIQAGKDYCVFTTRDSLHRLDYLVYEVNQTDFLVIDLSSDSTASVYMDEKTVTSNRVMREAEISSSLWNAMVGGGMNPALAKGMEDIYAWSIDFFALQKGDRFGLIYDEKYVDSTMIGAGTIWGSWFEYGGRKYYAIPFFQDGELGYWDENGNSLRKSFLLAPLSYTRISSGFSNGRLHPILRIVRPHHAVDYAAPAGTPVYAIGDGTITQRGWTSGGGNTIRIRHTTGKLESRYMHLQGFAKGIAVGSRVKQGEVIGYVGSTGLATGPHLDFAVYQNGVAINPLKIPSEPAAPIKEADRPAFNSVRDKIMAELDGTLPADSLKVLSLDMLSNDTVNAADR